ncbi:MAG: TolC family protein [Parachlamydia sp.]|nr:TolC family protein [Parachlamydia sp.]
MFKKVIPFFALTLLSGCIEPVTCLDEKRLAEAQQEIACFYRSLEDTIELSLDEAIELALDRNLDLMVNAQQLEVQRETFSRQTLTMLPTLNAHALWSYRTANTGSFSKSLVPTIPPAPPSLAQEQTINIWDITLTYKLVEFCIAYFRSTQEANKQLALQFEYRRNEQVLILHVVEQYWKLAAELRNMEQANWLSVGAESLKWRVEDMTKKGVISPENGARILAQLSIYQLQIDDARKGYHRTVADFKKTIGLPPDIVVVLTDPLPSIEAFELPPVQELEQLALVSRPELYSKDIQDLVFSDEVHVALMQLFPEVGPFVSSNYDANRYLIFNNWTIIGIHTAWNLLAIPLHWQEARLARKQKTLNHYQRLVLAMGVLSQVHLSYALLYDDIDRVQKLKALSVARNRLKTIADSRSRLQALGDMEHFVVDFDVFTAEADLRRAMAEAQGSLEQLNNSIGSPQYYRSNSFSCWENSLGKVQIHRDFFDDRCRQPRRGCQSRAAKKDHGDGLFSREFFSWNSCLKEMVCTSPSSAA